MNIKKELVDSAKQIREKYRALKRGRYLEAEERFQTFQPLIEPLKELKQIHKEESVGKQMPPIIPAILPKTPSRIPILSHATPQRLDFGLLASEYLGNYLNKKNITDSTYGIRREGNKFYIGNKEVEIASDDITIGDQIFKGSKGLWELLTLKEPTNHNEADLKTYKKILQLTSAHLKGYKPNAGVSSNKHSKYVNIIKPLFRTSEPNLESISEEDPTPEPVTGSGLRRVTGNKIDYIYWNDVNELVDRLRLLWLSKQAGNTGVDNEIESIIEELRENDIIY